MTALIGDATDFARALGWAAGGPSPSHHVGANSADVTGIARSTLLRPHSLARSMAATEGARFAGDRQQVAGVGGIDRLVLDLLDEFEPGLAAPEAGEYRVGKRDLHED
jgi:hypothetical protein